MKSIVKAALVAAVMVAPALSFAQSDSNSTVTRAQVKQDLRQVEAAGYEPGADRTTYPQDAQAAESRVSRQNGANAYGGAQSGSMASGMRDMPPMNNDGTKPVYFGR